MNQSTEIRPLERVAPARKTGSSIGAGLFRRVSLTAVLALVGLLSSACRQDMHNQPRYEPLEASDFFPDGRSSRLVLEGTVARGHLRENSHLHLGVVNGLAATTFPMEVTREMVQRGRQRYEIFCSPCHDSAGYGNGMIVQRGFRTPPSLHIERLRTAPVGHYFDVITNGFGGMYSYASRITAEDRWAIIAYIRALQLSQNASADDVPAGTPIAEESQ